VNRHRSGCWEIPPPSQYKPYKRRVSARFAPNEITRRVDTSSDMKWSSVTSWLPRKAEKKPRGAYRQKISGFMSQIGPLTDISSTGMRVKFDTGPKLSLHSVLNFHIQTDGTTFSVRGVVVWVRRKEAGIQFMDLSPEHAALIDYLARFARMPGPGERIAARHKTSEPRPRPTSAVPPPVKVAVEVEDLYAVLGVTPSADAETIKSAYRHLARQCHPDLSRKPEDAERFTLINKAFSVLRDPDLRRRYDQLLARSAA
jgi:hypothetical protein